MDKNIKIQIVCDNRDTKTILNAIEALKDCIERKGDTCGCVEGDEYVIIID